MGGEVPFPQSASMELGTQLFEAPVSESCRLIDFAKAKVVAGIAPDTWFLLVSGDKPWLNMTVNLIPVIYIDRPEYWHIEVVGCLVGISPAVVTPYDVSLEIMPDFGVGTKGVNVVGATKSEPIDVP